MLLEEAPIAVDSFNHPGPEQGGPQIFFCSHAHDDHLKGLGKKWRKGWGPLWPGNGMGSSWILGRKKRLFQHVPKPSGRMILKAPTRHCLVGFHVQQSMIAGRFQLQIDDWCPQFCLLVSFHPSNHGWLVGISYLYCWLYIPFVIPITSPFLSIIFTTSIKSMLSIVSLQFECLHSIHWLYYMPWYQVILPQT